MDVSHVILGRPWQYDYQVSHKEKDNFYTFYKDGKKIVLVPLNVKERPKTPKVEGRSLLVTNRILEEVEKN